jgi:hypothetical protein
MYLVFFGHQYEKEIISNRSIRRLVKIKMKYSLGQKSMSMGYNLMKIKSIRNIIKLGPSPRTKNFKMIKTITITIMMMIMMGIMKKVRRKELSRMI